MWPYPQHWDVEIVGAHSLSALIEMGEINYHRLLRLAPDLPDLPPHSLSRVEGCLDLHLEVLDHWRYTTNIVLTYRFADGDITSREPDLNIRIYHDARSAEAMSGILHARGPIDTLDPRFTLHHKWMLNRFLYKWLGYSLHRGHCFRCGSGPTREATRHPRAVAS